MTAHPGEEDHVPQTEDTQMTDDAPTELQGTTVELAIRIPDEEQGEKGVARKETAVDPEVSAKDHMPEAQEGEAEPAEEKTEEQKPKWQPIERPGQLPIIPVGHWGTEIFVKSDQGLCRLKPSNGSVFSDEFL